MAQLRFAPYITSMTTLSRLLAPIALLVFALPATAQEIPLAVLSTYLNSLTTAEAAFTQQNADGTMSSGKIYIRRPGRIRFEYAPPNQSLVIAAGGAVAVFDPKSNTPPAQYDLASTPLNLILAPNIDLGRARMVVAHRVEGDQTIVTAQDPAHPDYGTIELHFTANPTALAGWVVTDGSGARTAVTLSTLQTGGTMRDALFDIATETSRRLGH